MKKIIIVLFSILVIKNANAQTVNSNDTVKNVELPATIVKYGKRNLLDERNIKEITTEQIKQQNQAQDLPYILNGLSNVVVSSDAGTGTGYTDIKVRGTDLTRINVTMNGIPVNDPESQATYFVNMPDILSSAQGVELVKGVGNSKNGNGNFGASLAINNLDVNDNEAHVNFSTDYGSFNTYKNMLRATTGLINQKIVTTLRVSNVVSDGYIQRSNANLKALQISSKYIFNPNTTLVFNFLKGKEITGQAWNGVVQDSLNTNRTYNELGLKKDGSFYNNQVDNYGQDYYQLFFDKKINTSWSIGSALFYTKGKGFYEEYKTSQYFLDYGLNNFIINSDTFTNTDLIRRLWLNNHFYGGRLYANYFSKKVNAGLYVNVNQYDAKHYGNIIWANLPIENNYEWYKLTAYKSDINLYGMLDYKIDKHWDLLGDMQFRKVNYDLNGFRKNPALQHNFIWNFLNPKLKLSYKNKQHSFSAQIGIAHKEPNRDDIEAGKNNVPQAEKLLDVEMNYIYVHQKQLAFYVTAFYMKYNNQLVLTGKINDVGAYTRTNIPNSYRYGIELETKLKPTQIKWLEASANISLSQNKINNFTEYLDAYDVNWNYIEQKEITYTKTDISFSPNIVGMAQLSFFPFKNSNIKLKNTSFNLMRKYVGKQFLDNTANTQRQLKAFNTIDAFINIPYQYHAQQTITFRLGIYNVLNKKYEAKGYTYGYYVGQNLTTVNYYYPQAGLRYMIGVGFGF